MLYKIIKNWILLIEFRCQRFDVVVMQFRNSKFYVFFLRKYTWEITKMVYHKQEENMNCNQYNNKQTLTMLLKYFSEKLLYAKHHSK